MEDDILGRTSSLATLDYKVNWKNSGHPGEQFPQISD
jgi:hypothetical protein